MNKAELVGSMARAADITKAQATKALDSMIEEVIESLKSGDKVTLVGFGTFAVAERAARTGRNPRTNEPLTIPSKKVPKFKAGKQFVDAIQ